MVDGIDDGGPFLAPYGAPDPNDPNKALYGASLRDWFAGQFLSGRMAFAVVNTFDKSGWPEEVARAAYRFADAMIEARKQGRS